MAESLAAKRASLRGENADWQATEKARIERELNGLPECSTLTKGDSQMNEVMPDWLGTKVLASFLSERVASGKKFDTPLAKLSVVGVWASQFCFERQRELKRLGNDVMKKLVATLAVTLPLCAADLPKDFDPVRIDAVGKNPISLVVTKTAVGVLQNGVLIKRQGALDSAVVKALYGDLRRLLAALPPDHGLACPTAMSVHWSKGKGSKEFCWATLPAQSRRQWSALFRLF